MSATVVTWYISLDDALKIIRFFKQKKHRDAGYFFNLSETPFDFADFMKKQSTDLCFRNYSPKIQMWLLSVMREVDASGFSPAEIAALKKLVADLKLAD